MEIHIVPVSLKDLDKLGEIARRTFIQSFADLNTPENMQFYLDHHFSEDILSTEFKNPDSRFYFAHQGEELLGYLKLNSGTAQTVLPNEGGLEIERIYVDQASKNRGIGKLFVAEAHDLAQKINADYIWLGVWENNLRAIRFYEKCGFQTFSKHEFKLGDDLQTDLLMRKSV